MTPRRYHPALVALHWLLAVLLVAALVAGGVVLEDTPNSDPSKVDSLRAHMTLGIAILVLMLVRLAVRLFTRRPAPAVEGPLAAVAAVTHWGLYAAAIGMAASGMALSVAAGLPGIVFGGEGALPADFAGFTARVVHGLFANILMLLILLHVAAALWHQVVRRDGLMARMWFGPR